MFSYVDIYLTCIIYIIVYAYFNFLFTHDNSYSQKNTVTEPLISISQNVSIIPITGITDEVNRCYQPSVDEKWALYEGGE